MTEKKYNIDASQKSGLNSDSEQNQKVFVDGTHHHYAGEAFKKLTTIHDGQLTFDPHTLKEVIIKVDEGIGVIDEERIDFSTSIDINKKNILNNHSKEYFEDFVELDFYPQFYKLDKFFALKENQKTIQPRVDRVIKSLDMKIRAYQNGEKFEVILLKICDKLIDIHHEALKDKEAEVLLILYYFYCNCCIGRKTEEELNAST